jgi:hypothetical protein
MKGGVAFLLLRLLAGCLIAVWTGRCAAGLVRHSLTDNWNGGGGARAPQALVAVVARRSFLSAQGVFAMQRSGCTAAIER